MHLQNYDSYFQRYTFGISIKYHLRIKMVDEKYFFFINLISIFVSLVFILSLVFFKFYVKYYFHLIFIIFKLSSPYSSCDNVFQGTFIINLM